MKIAAFIIPFSIALFAAIGNAIVTLGQKKAGIFPNPFFFGAFSLLFASVFMFCIAFLYKTEGLTNYIYVNYKWFAVSGIGLVFLNVFLYFLYRRYGANSYTLYSMLAICTTSILLAVFVFREKMNSYYWLALCLAILTVLIFMKGKAMNI